METRPHHRGHRRRPRQHTAHAADSADNTGQIKSILAKAKRPSDRNASLKHGNAPASSWTPAAATAAHRPRRRLRRQHRANKINSRKSQTAFRSKRFIEAWKRARIIVDTGGGHGSTPPTPPTPPTTPGK